MAFNIAVLLFIVLFLLTPVLSHFASRSEEISESAAQLAHFRQIARSSGTLDAKALQGSDPFLPGSEERIVSADLQASVKALATHAGVNLRGIRGLQGNRSRQLRMVAVGVELEGSASAVRDMIIAIESQKPLLFVVSASFRSVSDGEDGPLRAELTVQGAMRDSGLPSATEAVPQ